MPPHRETHPPLLLVRSERELANCAEHRDRVDRAHKIGDGRGAVECVVAVRVAVAVPPLFLRREDVRLRARRDRLL
jgi:hypothetical protein